MPRAKKLVGEVKLRPDQIQYLKERMAHLAERNPSWGHPCSYAVVSVSVYPRWTVKVIDWNTKLSRLTETRGESYGTRETFSFGN